MIDLSKEEIDDVFVKFDMDLMEVVLMAETVSGRIVELDTVSVDSAPSFTDESLPIDATDYGDWYDVALRTLHAFGYRLSGEEDGDMDG